MATPEKPEVAICIPSIIDIFPVAYFDHQDRENLIFQVANGPVIPDTVPPKASPVANQGFAELPGVFGSLKSFPEIFQYALARLMVQAAQIIQSLLLLAPGFQLSRTFSSFSASSRLRRRPPASSRARPSR